MQKLADAWNRFWFADASLMRLGVFRALVMLLCLADLIAYSGVNLDNARAVSDGTIGKPWNPIFLFEVLGVQPPSLQFAQGVFVVGIVSISFAIVGLFTRTACFVAALVVIYWTAFNYSFAKIHHDKVSLAFVVIMLPLAPVGARFSVDALLRTWRKRTPLPVYSSLAGFPLRVTQLTICIGYGAAGITKLVVRGLDWGNGYTLMGILMHYSTEWSGVLSQNVELCRWLSFATLFVQATFPIILLFPALRWFYLPAAVGFHIGTWQTMDTGPYMTLWFLLIAFLPLERIPSWLRNNVRSGSVLRATSATLLVVLPTALVTRVLFYYFPSWAGVLCIPPVVSLVWFVFSERDEHTAKHT